MHVLLLAAALSAQFVVDAPADKAQCLRTSSGGVVCGYGCATGASGHGACAPDPGGLCMAGADGRVACSPPRSAPLRVSSQPATCLLGADGRATCGYACVRGADGRAACADVVDGACAVGANGKAVCSTSSSARVVVLTAFAPPVCERAADGTVACGYACLRAANGGVRCATTPDGACARDATGGVACTSFDPATRVVAGGLPEAECMRGADGQAVCGYGCAKGSNGRAVCAPSPFMACGQGADGVARCGP